MRINSMKLLVVTQLILILTGIILGLFYVEIPVGNREVSYMLLGGVLSILVESVANLFRKPKD